MWSTSLGVVAFAGAAAKGPNQKVQQDSSSSLTALVPVIFGPEISRLT